MMVVSATCRFFYCHRFRCIWYLTRFTVRNTGRNGYHCQTGLCKLLECKSGTSILLDTHLDTVVWYTSPLLYVHSLRAAWKKAIPLQAWTGLRFPGGWGSQISTQSTHEGGKVVNPTHRPPLPPGNIPGTHFCLGGKDYVNEKFHWHHRESIPRHSGL
jgi:hypothetical protein